MLIVNIKQQSATFLPRKRENNTEECHILSRPTFNQHQLTGPTSGQTYTQSVVFLYFFYQRINRYSNAKYCHISYIIYSIHTLDLQATSDGDVHAFPYVGSGFFLYFLLLIVISVEKNIFLLSVFLVCAYLLIWPLLDNKLMNFWYLQIGYPQYSLCLAYTYWCRLCFTNNAQTCLNFTTWLVLLKPLCGVFLFYKARFLKGDRFLLFFSFLFIFCFENRLFNFPTKLRNKMLQ